MSHRKQHAMPQDSQDVFPFEKLPAELRNMVYEYALIHDTPNQFRRGKRWDNPQRFKAHILDVTYRGPRGGTRTGLPIIYAQNTFAFETDPALELVVDRVKSEVPLIRNILFYSSSRQRTNPHRMTIALKTATGLQVLEWTISGLDAPRDLDYYFGDIMRPVKIFVGLADRSPAARREQYNKVRFVAASVPPGQALVPQDGKTVAERLVEFKDDVERGLVISATLQPLQQG